MGMKVWPRVRLAINGFAVGVYLSLFVISFAMGLNPLAFLVGLVVTSGLLAWSFHNGF